MGVSRTPSEEMRRFLAKDRGGAMTENAQITELLTAWSDGNSKALDDLLPLVYGEMRRMAARHMRGERVGHTLQTTGLVHEAFLRLVEQSGIQWQNRSQFFSVASKLMRRILVDQARARLAAKRGGGCAPGSIDELDNVADELGNGDFRDEQIFGAGSRVAHVDLLGIHSALTRLECLDARQAQIVEMRFFGGLTIEETARVLSISIATVKRDWSMAKAWLARELIDQAGA
jgi:RNA polymerase sigma factor (sigma-70 family)